MVNLLNLQKRELTCILTHKIYEFINIYVKINLNT
jgi:hypothetical protein